MHLVDRIEQLLREPVITNRSIEALGIGILLRLTGLNVFDQDSIFTGPCLHSATDVFGIVIAPNYSLFPAQADDLLQRPDQSLCR